MCYWTLSAELKNSSGNPHKLLKFIGGKIWTTRSALRPNNGKGKISSDMQKSYVKLKKNLKKVEKFQTIKLVQKLK